MACFTRMAHALEQEKEHAAQLQAEASRLRHEWRATQRELDSARWVEGVSPPSFPLLIPQWGRFGAVRRAGKRGGRWPPSALVCAERMENG